MPHLPAPHSTPPPPLCSTHEADFVATPGKMPGVQQREKERTRKKERTVYCVAGSNVLGGLECWDGRISTCSYSSLSLESPSPTPSPSPSPSNSSSSFTSSSSSRSRAVTLPSHSPLLLLTPLPTSTLTLPPSAGVGDEGKGERKQKADTQTTPPLPTQAISSPGTAQSPLPPSLPSASGPFDRAETRSKSRSETRVLNRGVETPSFVSEKSSMGSASSSPRLRRAEQRSGSLRTRFEMPGPGVVFSSGAVLGLGDGMRAEEVAQSVVEGLFADDFEVYEENGEAVAAPIVHGVDARVVDVWGERAGGRVQEGWDEDSILDILDTSLYANSRLNTLSNVTPASSISISRILSSSSPRVVVPTMPLEILSVIAYSAAYGNIASQALASKLSTELKSISKTPDADPRWGEQEQRLIHMAEIVMGLERLARQGYVADGVFEAVRRQFFPTVTEEQMQEREFRECVHGAVYAAQLDGVDALHILLLAVGEQDLFMEGQHFECDEHNHACYHILPSTSSICLVVERRRSLRQAFCVLWWKLVKAIRAVHRTRSASSVPFDL